MRPAAVEQIIADADDLRHRMEALAEDVAATAEGAERSFYLEREAERELLLDLLQAVRPAFKWIRDREGPVSVAGIVRRYAMVVLDAYRTEPGTDPRLSNPGPSYEWVAFEHPELGLAVARWRVACGDGELAWPGQDLPFGREGGPRLARVVCNLADRLAAHAQGNTSRRRREAGRMTERLRAIQTLLRGP